MYLVVCIQCPPLESVNKRQQCFFDHVVVLSCKSCLRFVLAVSIKVAHSCVGDLLSILIFKTSKNISLLGNTSLICNKQCNSNKCSTDTISSIVRSNLLFCVTFSIFFGSHFKRVNSCLSIFFLAAL